MKVNPAWDKAESGLEAKQDHVIQGASDECQKFYESAREAEPAISSDMKGIAHDNGIAMHGLEYSVKTGDSIAEKLGRKMAKNEEVSDQVTDVDIIKSFGDLIRYTFICEHDEMAPTTMDVVSGLEEKGYHIYELDNKWKDPNPDSGYRGMHINVVAPSGHKMEVQIHSEESQTAKDSGHAIYEETRKPGISNEGQEPSTQGNWACVTGIACMQAVSLR